MSYGTPTVNKMNLNNIQNIESITRKLQTEGVWGLVHDTILLRWFRNLSPDPTLTLFVPLTLPLTLL